MWHLSGMNLRLLTVPLLSLILPAVAAPPTVKCCGVSVVAEHYGDGFEALRPFQAFDDGVRVAFMVKAAEGGLLSFDADGGSVTEFVDDKGTALLLKDKFKNGFGAFPKISEDGKAAVFTVEGTVPPAAGAKTATVKGTAVFRMASKQETVKGDPAAFKKGAVLPCGKLSVTVEKIEASGGETSVTLKATENLDGIKEYRFLDAAGKVLKSESGGRSSFSFGSSRQYSVEWNVKGKPAALEFVRWTDMQVVKVPFAATVGIATGE